MSVASADPAAIVLGDRPLIVCDVDEVVLEFLTPFSAYLGSRDHELLPRSFRLNGNIVSRPDGIEASRPQVAEFLEDFYDAQPDWQTPVAAAADTLARLSAAADIVFLTAMPPRHQHIRRRLLDASGMTYPMIATEDAKGPAVSALHAGRPLPLAFIDDISANLHSVRAHAPAALLVNLMANVTFRALAPHPGDGVAIARDWAHAETLIGDHFRKPARG
ncbi:hypothetical protein DFR52_101979 [Hoeflea marina]|uniref:Uncharacterized protein n=1 Tax=Hoeflea marina TaxID=274592 RepID=A0A317PUC1_9HYPH|nr:hypothetical protein [Hoeflea marina]PWW04284.1 hypothetical protein DFR52_101979 [Hoeflea marina]